jgi:hypothetical protein
MAADARARPAEALAYQNHPARLDKFDPSSLPRPGRSSEPATDPSADQIELESLSATSDGNEDGQCHQRARHAKQQDRRCPGFSNLLLHS